MDQLEMFYNNSVILITGGTGFLGKVLVEKLLRNFNIKKIFLLIRLKNNYTNVNERLQNYFTESVFDRIREENPDVFQKVFPIEVNYNAMDLDISETERETILNEVEIVFNIVASVKFNEKLRDAFNINVIGSKKIMKLILKMKKLKSFLHISTLFSNCNRKIIEEKVYETDVNVERMIQMFHNFDDDIELFYKYLMNGMPNTYTLTKKYAENLINLKAYHLPAGIFRPPIVLSTYKEPFPGWTDNLNGPSGLCVWTAKGFIHCIFGNKTCTANLVPADYCINAMIAAGWDTNQRFLERQSKFKPLPVYNYMFTKNNLTWGEYMNLSKKGLEIPLEKTFWYFSYIIVSSKYMYKMAEFTLHTIPGYILDTLATLTGRKRIYIKGYIKLQNAIHILSYFGLREWTFKNDNIKNLSNLLKSNQQNFVPKQTEKNKINLDFNLENIDWKIYFRSYLFGIKKYYLKENFTKINKMKKNYKRLYWIHLAVQTLFWILFSAFSGKLIKFIVVRGVCRVLKDF